MKVTITGGTGTIGRAVAEELLARGDEVTLLSRDARKASSAFGGRVRALEWKEPQAARPPTESLEGQDGVVHLLGEPLDQRWNDDTKREIRDSRVLTTRNLVEAIKDAQARPSVLVSQSASGVYGPRGDEPVDESAPVAHDFLAGVCVEWEAEARRAEEVGVRVAVTRTGVVLAEDGGALARMLPFFKAGVGGPVAGGGQYLPWIHLDDEVGALIFALDTEAASGPLNVSAPEPVTNKELSKALGRVLRRPAVAPVPAFALKLMYGEMAQVVTTGVRMVPKRLEELGYEFRRPALEPALRAALGK